MHILRILAYLPRIGEYSLAYLPRIRVFAAYSRVFSRIRRVSCISAYLLRILAYPAYSPRIRRIFSRILAYSRVFSRIRPRILAYSPHIHPRILAYSPRICRVFSRVLAYFRVSAAYSRTGSVI